MHRFTSFLLRTYLAHFQRLCEETMELGGARVTEWMNRVDEDYANIRAAFAWARERSAIDRGEAMLRIAAGLRPYRHNRGGLLEGLAWLDEALAVGVDASAEARALALLAKGTNGWLLDSDAAIVPIRQSLGLFQKIEHDAGMACALETISMHDQDKDAALRALALAQKAGLRAVEARAMRNIGGIALLQANAEGTAQAAWYFRRAFDIGLDNRDRNAIFTALTSLSVAEPKLAESLGIRALNQLGDTLSIEERATLHNALGIVYANGGKLEDARRELEIGLHCWRSLGTQVAMHAGIGPSVSYLGWVYYALNDVARAVELWSEAQQSANRGLGTARGVTSAEVRMAMWRGDHMTAIDLVRKALLRTAQLDPTRRTAEHAISFALIFQDFGLALLGLQKRQDAFRLIGAASVAMANNPPVDFRNSLMHVVFSRDVDEARGLLQNEEDRIAWSEGESMTLDAAVDYALNVSL